MKNHPVKRYKTFSEWMAMPEKAQKRNEKIIPPVPTHKHNNE
jgi:hypothetical protein